MTAAQAQDRVETVEISDPARLAGNPTVSVLMLVYNHREHLAEAIESVVRQDADFPVEILIGEDCSTDGSREIVADYQRRYPERIRIVTAGRNVGAYRNCMRLFEAARGEFIAQIDGDDYWLPGKLSSQVELLQRHPGASAVYANALVVGGEGAGAGRFNDAGDAEFDLGSVLRRGNFFCTSTLMFRAGSLGDLRAIAREFIDFQTHLTLAGKGSLLHVGKPMAAYRLRSTTSMVANDNARVRELYWQAIQSVPRDMVTDDDYAHGLADFMRRVFFRAVSTRNASLWREWKPRVFAASPYGAARMYWLTAANILRMLAREAFGRLRRDADGKRLRVLYRR